MKRWQAEVSGGAKLDEGAAIMQHSITRLWLSLHSQMQFNLSKDVIPATQAESIHALCSGKRFQNCAVICKYAGRKSKTKLKYQKAQPSSCSAVDVGSTTNHDDL
jgi:hypothetical protein